MAREFRNADLARLAVADPLARDALRALDVDPMGAIARIFGDNSENG